MRGSAGADERALFETSPKDKYTRDSGQVRHPELAQTKSNEGKLGMWPRRRRPRRPLLPQFAELVGIVGFLALAYHGVLWYWERTAPASVRVPEIVGLPQDEAAKVLSGDDPCNLPVQTFTIIRIYVNPGAAGRMGATIPQPLIDRAYEIIK